MFISIYDSSPEITNYISNRSAGAIDLYCATLVPSTALWTGFFANIANSDFVRPYITNDDLWLTRPTKMCLFKLFFLFVFLAGEDEDGLRHFLPRPFNLSTRLCVDSFTRFGIISLSCVSNDLLAISEMIFAPARKFSLTTAPARFHDAEETA
jgi:hypothetical protein